MFTRVIVIVMDSVGAGALPDAAEYGDLGVNTLGNIARSQGGLFLPTLQQLGLGNILPLAGVAPTTTPLASFGKMAEISKGKDTTFGHWELAGCPLFAPFPVFPHGFPAAMIEQITEISGRPVIGNKAASGTEIIAELGEEHERTGALIVYTSADSVLQIAAHESVVPLDELNTIAKKVRQQVCVGPGAVGRVITRPFTGERGRYVRTATRHDYSVEPPAATMLDAVKASGRQVVGVGKIGDIFAGRGLTATYPTKSNDHGMQVTADLVREAAPGLVFVNLVEFDSVYGHRNDSKGYAQALQRLDGQLALLLPLIGPTDLLMLAADHGCDPTATGTDHTREYVPLLVYADGRPGRDLGVRTTFADVAATVLANFALPPFAHGLSFLDEIMG